MKLTIKDVEYVARLARLELSAAEKDKYAGQLELILGHIGELAKADTSNVMPTSHALALSNVWRRDEASPSSGGLRERLLSNAPELSGGFYKVKKVIE